MRATQKWRAWGRRLRRIGRGMLLGFFVLSASIACMEASLQLASLIVRQFAPRSSASFGQSPFDGITILCVGDSHTYGLPLPEDESYPAQLEAALTSRYSRQRFRVVNLGIPGANSAFVTHRLARELFQLRPQLVIVWVGINNRWNVAEWRDDLHSGAESTLRRGLMPLRLFRLASIAWFAHIGHQYDPEARGGWFQGERYPTKRLRRGLSAPDPTPGLARDLARMVELTHSMETPILFLTYPLKSAQDINRVILRTAGRLGVDAIETSRDLRLAAFDGHSQQELIDRSMGPHPARLLYAYVVRSLLPRVVAELETWHGFELGPGATGRAEERLAQVSSAPPSPGEKARSERRQNRAR